MNDDESKKSTAAINQVSLAHFTLEKSLVWGQKAQVYMRYDSIVYNCTI